MSRRFGNRGEERDRLQLKVFKKWVNSNLRKKDIQIDDLSTCFNDGVNLCILFETISGEKLPRYNLKPRNFMQKISNLSVVLKRINSFVDQLGIRLQYSPQQIASNEIRQILGMLWILVSKFVIPETEEKNTSAKRALLKWVQKVTEGYDNLKITNFNKSWKDGLGFCALIHQFDNELLDYESLKAENDRENCDLAFKVAWEQLQIDQLLDPEDIVDVAKVDDKIVMTYVALLYHYFKRHYKDSLEKRAKQFEERSERLIQWIERCTGQYSVTNFDQYDISDAQKKLDEFMKFLDEEKKKYSNYKAKMNLELSHTQREQKKKRLKIYIPAERHSLSSMEKAWSNLNSIISDYGATLRKYISSKKSLQNNLVEEYDIQCTEFIKWGNQAQLEFIEKKDSESEDLEGYKKKVLSELESKFKSVSGKFNQVVKEGVVEKISVDKREFEDVKESLQFLLTGEGGQHLEKFKGFQLEF